MLHLVRACDVEPDEIGVIAISGDHVSPGYRDLEHNSVGVFEDGSAELWRSRLQGRGRGGSTSPAVPKI